MIYPFVSSLFGDEFVIVLYAWFLRIIRAICAPTRYTIKIYAKMALLDEILTGPLSYGCKPLALLVARVTAHNALASGQGVCAAVSARCSAGIASGAVGTPRAVCPDLGRHGRRQSHGPQSVRLALP